ncbi:signal peptidase I [Vallitaleaceae bacterium 9-2]
MSKEKIKEELISWTKVIVFAMTLAYVINHLVIINAYVPSQSMENTLQVKDRLIANRLAYLFNEPKRGDVVIFEFDQDGEEKHYVKRLIGLPGDIVNIREGNVYVNDQLLKEPYLKEAMDNNEDGNFEVPKGYYFFLGDNRNKSIDGRFWVKPYISKKAVLGKVVLSYYPNFRLITGQKDK